MCPCAEIQEVIAEGSIDLTPANLEAFDGGGGGVASDDEDDE